MREGHVPPPDEGLSKRVVDTGPITVSALCHALHLIHSPSLQYNALWLRLLGFNELLPNQAALFGQMETFYANTVMQEFGVPLNSRKLFTKDDWMTFLVSAGDLLQLPFNGSD